MHSPCDAAGVQSPDRTSISSSDTEPYATVDADVTHPDLSCDAEVSGDTSLSCSDVVSAKRPTDEESNCSVRSPIESSSVLPHNVINAETVDSSSSQSVGSSLPTRATDASYGILTTSVNNTTVSNTATYYPLPGKFRFRNVGNAAAEDSMSRSHISFPVSALSTSSEMKRCVTDRDGPSPTVALEDSKTETVPGLRGAASKVVCKVESSEQRMGPVELSSHVTSSVTSFDTEVVDGPDVKTTRHSKASGCKLTTVCSSPKSRMFETSSTGYSCVNRCEVNCTETSPRQAVRQIGQLSRSESNVSSENACIAKTACASASRVHDVKAGQGSFVASVGVTENHKMNCVGKSSFQGNRIALGNSSSQDERDNLSKTAGSSWQTRLGKLQAIHANVKRKSDVVNSSITNGNGQAMNILDRLPVSVANTAANGTTTDVGLHKFNLLPNGGMNPVPPVAHQTFNGTPLGGFGSLSSSSFGSHPHGASARSIRPLPPQSVPRIDNMLMGLPIISGIAPNGILPWPPRPPLNHSFLPTESAAHILAASHVRPVAQAALDYVSHLRPNCGLSPLAIHSPRSMSPRIPQPSCRSTLISPVPPTSRLSISIPPPSPTPGTEYHRQPLGDGILTTQPPGSLFLTNARTVVANGRSALPVGSLVGSAMLQWPQQPPIIHFG